MSRSCCLTNAGALSGHRVSHSDIKTNRRFLPNLQRISLKSDALAVGLNLRIATKTLRTINKYGSLDSFLVNFGYRKLSLFGRALRKRVIRKLMDRNELTNLKVTREKKKNKESLGDEETGEVKEASLEV
ncbi:MAG: 50S ribosomal protein L28 [Rickettsiales bacterium]|jgi:large subunit ribosomal protein L28|nr:50S ribosomal protein L28 [Rickettsiales bacterium]